jgi:hypothetical protein
LENSYGNLIFSLKTSTIWMRRGFY